MTDDETSNDEKMMQHENRRFGLRWLSSVLPVVLTIIDCVQDDEANKTSLISSNQVDAAEVVDAKKTVDQPAQSITNSIGMNLARIPADKFLMRSADSAPGAREDERPQHKVFITKPFYIGIYKVLQTEFKSVMGFNASFYSKTGPVKDRLA